MAVREDSHSTPPARLTRGRGSSPRRATIL
nr:MAG TPA: hypothetical protein [Caudoviricetes sp.]